MPDSGQAGTLGGAKFCQERHDLGWERKISKPQPADYNQPGLDLILQIVFIAGFISKSLSDRASNWVNAHASGRTCHSCAQGNSIKKKYDTGNLSHWRHSGGTYSGTPAVVFKGTFIKNLLGTCIK